MQRTTQPAQVTKTVSLSKSKLNAYHQCKKRLWLEVNRLDLLEVPAETQRVFATGHQVGALARREHDGILVAEDVPWSEAAKQTQAALAERSKRAVFEAAVAHDDVYVRADLLIPVGGGFHLAEVKSTGSVKPYHAADVAVQTWVLRGAGIPVRSVELRHINTSFVYRGRDDYKGLFARVDVQAEVEKLQPEVPKWVDDAKAVLGGAEPDVPMGTQCAEPYPCPFKQYCASLVEPGPKYPITLLKGKKALQLAEELAEEGIFDLREVPDARLGDDEKFRRIHRATKTGKPFVDPAAREEIGAWPYPRYYLDFETIMSPSPAGSAPGRSSRCRSSGRARSTAVTAASSITWCSSTFPATILRAGARRSWCRRSAPAARSSPITRASRRA